MKKMLASVTFIIVLLSSCKKENFVAESSTSSSIQDSKTAAVSSAVFVGDNTSFYCINAANGTVIWKNYTNTASMCAPAYYNSNVYYNAKDTVYCLNARTGALVWKSHVGNALQSCLYVRDGIVLINNNTKIVCLNAATGATKWKFLYGATTRLIVSSPTADGNLVFTSGGSDHTLYSLNAGTGAVVWQRTFTGGNFGSGLESSPCVSNGRVFITADSTFALNENNGSVIWKDKLDGNGQASSAIHNGRLIVPDGHLYSLNPATGTAYWTFFDTSLSNPTQVFYSGADSNNIYTQCGYFTYKLLASNAAIFYDVYNGESSNTSFTVGDNKIVWVGYERGYLVCADAANGNTIWMFKFSDEDVSSTPIIVTSKGQASYPDVSGMTN